MAEKQHKKPVLIFVPHYIGSSKYFEKLAPFVEEKYDVIFFLSFVHQKFFTEMKKAAALSGRVVFAPEPPKSISIIDWIPYVYFVRNLRRYKKDVLDLFGNSDIKKIIAVNDSGPYSRFLFSEAKKKGIGTFVLQWAMSFEGARARAKKKTTVVKGFVYRFGKPIYASFKRKLIALILGRGFAPSKDLIGRGNAEKFGVINEQTKEFFLSQGVPADKLSVVGYLDFYLGQKTKEDFDRDEDRRAAAARRLGLDTSKKHIVFLSSPYNGKDIQILDDKGQLEFTERVVKEIRAVCSDNEYDILLKMHPSENVSLYEPLKKYGVTLYDKNTNNYELIYFADLYLAGGTATNFVPLVMGKDSLFINFLNIPVVESTKKVFNITSFVHDYSEFNSLLQKFKNGQLPKQYEAVETITTKDSLKKILAWID